MSYEELANGHQIIDEELESNVREGERVLPLPRSHPARFQPVSHSLSLNVSVRLSGLLFLFSHCNFRSPSYALSSSFIPSNALLPLLHPSFNSGPKDDCPIQAASFHPSYRSSRDQLQWIRVRLRGSSSATWPSDSPTAGPRAPTPPLLVMSSSPRGRPRSLRRPPRSLSSSPRTPSRQKPAPPRPSRLASSSTRPGSISYYSRSGPRTTPASRYRSTGPAAIRQQVTACAGCWAVAEEDGRGSS